MGYNFKAIVVDARRIVYYFSRLRTRNHKNTRAIGKNYSHQNNSTKEVTQKERK